MRTGGEVEGGSVGARGAGIAPAEPPQPATTADASTSTLAQPARNRLLSAAVNTADPSDRTDTSEV
jgi:hypothetical protein